MLQPYCLPDRVECGVDEAGRGALAGPVVAAAVVWDPTCTDAMVSRIRDSKKVSAKERKVLAEFIQQHAIAWGVGFVDNQTIDEINILNATFRAMHAAIDQVNSGIDHLLIDGNRFASYRDIPHTCVVKGDGTYISIAAASILAKEARDEYMRGLASEDTCGVYKWEQNMGYGTADHMSAIKEYGLSKYHRMSFRLKVY